MALQSSELSFKYNAQSSFVFPPLGLKPAESALLLGPSGSGKSTLLHLLAGLLEPAKGEVTIGAQNLHALKGQARDRFRGEHLGIIFQRSHFLPYLTICENLKLAAQAQNARVSTKQIHHLLDRLNIGALAAKKPSDCSLGEQQRAAIARAILHKPQLILADEPTSALDDHNAQKVTKLLQQMAQEAQAALLIVTHDGRLKEHISKTYML